MSDDRMIIAIGRIERALSRIESAATLPAPAEDTLKALQEKHAQLRADTSDALAELDQVIGQLRGNGHG